MSDTLGVIKSIEEVSSLSIAPIAPLNGKGGRQGFVGMLNNITGSESMEGYKVVTDQHTYHVLIASESSCCESFGYLTSDDDLQQYIGAELREVRLTDTALNQHAVDKSGYYEEDGGIQFVDFATDRGVLQLAVYNAHNGYYGHSILIARDDEVLLSDTL